MAGFTWSPPAPQLRLVPGDGWCVRDALCQLFGWPIDSEEGLRFVENPEGADLYRLIEHLGLEWYDPAHQPHEEELATRLDHPGIVLYGLTYIPTPQ